MNNRFVIIGAGPAGTVLGNFLLQQGVKDVTIIEKESFPRHHIAESLQPDILRIFQILGIDRSKLSHFPKKYGAIYKWGKFNDRWSVLYDKNLDTAWSLGNSIDISKTEEYGFNVDRSFFDTILLDEFLKRGGVVKHAKVKDIIIEDDAVTEIILDSGERMYSDYYIDASGQNSMIGTKLGLKVIDSYLKNSAIYGYYKGYSGLDPLLGKDFQYIETLGDCWYWWIPISYDIVSVGIVSNTERKYTTNEYFEKMKDTEIYESIKDAQFCDAEGKISNKNYYISDWSFITKRMSGKNWFLLGDAAGFVDPILSGGVSFAMEKAIFLGKILVSLGTTHDENIIKVLKEKYDMKYKHDILNYLKMAYAWYRCGNAKEEWLKLSGDKAGFIDSISGGRRFIEQNKIFQGWQNEKIIHNITF